ncbi:MAG TPA: preprotein translocase subunit SecA [Planctomycetes bacterium]|nr:preprotein translocase subunit SecA [Planctomycetota bacterium]
MAIDFGSLPTKIGKGLQKIFGSQNERELKLLQPLVQKVGSLEDWARGMDHEAILKRVAEWKAKIQAGDASLDDALPEMFAMTRVAAERTLQMRHFDVQILGGIVLHQGKIAEMVTGEGKTLVATLPAALNALSGKGVFVVTVNDYLAQRDRDWMAPVYEYLGLTVGAIQSNMGSEERHPQYESDITYGTNNEFGFDYLRDNMKVVLEDQVQKRLNYAIIDEVDSILVDEARTPLIISGPPEGDTDKYLIADRIARQLKEGEDFEVKLKEKQALLLESGIEKAEKMVGVDSFYSDPAHMEWPHNIEQSLRAHHIYQLDKDYVVKGDEIIIVDEFTGRLMPGRRWSDGLHQAVEAKEGIKPKQENLTLATITFQNYFRLFEKIAGMTGTAMTEAGEFSKIYKLDVVMIPTNRPLIRKDQDDQIYLSDKDKYDRIAEEVKEKLSEDRPVLIGTTSIEKSEKLSRKLSSVGIKHEVLNAKHHEREAQIVAKAGEKGSVVVATNMAGRGTDIKLGEDVVRKECHHPETGETWCCIGCERPERASNCASCFKKKKDPDAWMGGIFQRCVQGEKARKFFKKSGMTHPWSEETNWNDPPCGLHIIGTERHEARRIDNQLRGRCGRQGDPGSTRFFLSFDDDLMRIFARDWVKTVMEKLGLREGEAIEAPMVSRGIAKAQKRVEDRNFEIRKSLLEYDEVMDKQRKFIYGQRQEVLEGKGLEAKLRGMFEDQTDEILGLCVPEKEEEPVDVEQLKEWWLHKFGTDEGMPDFAEIPREQLFDGMMAAFDQRLALRKEELGEEDFQAILRYLLLDAIDQKWKDHLKAMDALKEGIGLRGYAQVDPKNEYKKEGFQKFNLLKGSIGRQVTDLFFRVDLRARDLQMEDPFAGGGAMPMAPQMPTDPEEAKAVIEAMAAAGQLPPEVMEALRNGAEIIVDEEGISITNPNAPASPEEAGSPDAPLPEAPVEEEAVPVAAELPFEGKKPGRNDPCPCGSGKKFKKCHGKAS